MPGRRVLVVVVDGFRASAFGAYGNTSFPTPALDKFAAESLLLDCCYAEAPEIANIYRALWQSIHPASALSAANDAYLPRQLSEAGYATTLVSDDPEIFSLAGANGFTQCERVVTNEPSTRAAAINRTALARLFDVACDAVHQFSKDGPRLIWVHSRGMYGLWDAPLELQRALLDENDPDPIETIVPPDCLVDKTRDPDTAFRHGCAYAAQVMVLDECWNALLEALESAGGGDEWLVTLIGARGYPLGEHGRIGGVDPRLFADQLHVPWLIKFPDGLGRLARSNRLVSHIDLWPTLAEWTSVAGPPTSPGMSILPLGVSSRVGWRDDIVSVSGTDHAAIRTAEWCLRQTAPEGENLADADPANVRSELYVRPDDRWEANDVAKLCSEEVEILSDNIKQAFERLSGQPPRPASASTAGGR